MSFLLLCLYLFCTFIRPQEWVPMVLGAPLINSLALLIFVFLCAERMMASKQGFIKVPQNNLMIGLYFAVVMSHVSHLYLAGTIASVKTFLVVFLLYFLMLNAINTSRKYKIAVWLIVFLVTILVFQGIDQVRNGYGWAGQFPVLQGGKLTPLITRITWVGIFGDPNDLALTFVIAVGIAFPFIFGRTNIILWPLSILVVGLLFYGIYLTNSRGGLLALMATIYMFMVRRTGKIFWGSIIGGMLAAVVLIFGPSRVGSISSGEASAYSRVEYWYQSILFLKSNPIFGIGLNMYTDTMPQTAHNSYALAFAELGFFGFYMWMGLLYVSFLGLTRIQERVPQLYNYALGLQCGLVGFCAAAFFLSRTYVIIPYLIFALTGSLMHIAQQINPDVKFEFTKKDMRNNFLICLGTIVLIYVTIKVAI